MRKLISLDRNISKKKARPLFTLATVIGLVFVSAGAAASTAAASDLAAQKAVVPSGVATAPMNTGLSPVIDPASADFGGAIFTGPAPAGPTVMNNHSSPFGQTVSGMAKAKAGSHPGVGPEVSELAKERNVERKIPWPANCEPHASVATTLGPRKSCDLQLESLGAAQ